MGVQERDQIPSMDPVVPARRPEGANPARPDPIADRARIDLQERSGLMGRQKRFRSD